jgi:hypothetical protein
MGGAHDILAKLRKRLHTLKCQKFQHFDEFEPIIKHTYKSFAPLFPSYRETKDGSRVVYNFNVAGAAPISLEKEHGSREYIPRRFAKRAIEGISDIFMFIESALPETEEQEPIEGEPEIRSAIEIEEAKGEGDDDILLQDDEEEPA